ncbi:MAG TPA: hypothetical protein VFN91_11390 [Myxococcaceae bacterium]|nr:hypothetical protein [Myxococcaceae bacterium]
MTWFRRTGQTWKLVIFTLTCWVALLSRFVSRGAHEVSLAVSFAVFVWFVVSARCPFCGGRPVWFMASRMNVADFDPGGLQRCPICRDTGDVLPVNPPLFSSYRRM